LREICARSLQKEGGLFLADQPDANYTVRVIHSGFEETYLEGGSAAFFFELA
jgi:hypothetical protein